VIRDDVLGAVTLVALLATLYTLLGMLEAW
jgi:hypothetical protein